MLATTDPWAFEAQPLVWGLGLALVVARVWAVRRIGPHTPHIGPLVTSRQRVWFVLAVAALVVALGWPLAGLATDHLAAAMVAQHLLLGYALPALVLLSTPTWLARWLVGDRRSSRYRAVRAMRQPVVAGLAFSAVLVVAHMPGVVEAAAASAAVRLAVDAALVVLGASVWMSICGPLPELRLSYPGQLGFLFGLSIVPAVPGAWLAFAEGEVYRHYAQAPVRVFGLSATTDQQIAGALMKLGGSLVIAAVIVVIFFRRFITAFEAQQQRTRGRGRPATSAPLAGYDGPLLTYDQVADVFVRHPAPAEAAARPDPPGPSGAADGASG
jgi:cytochrome c oxidase assembly factor CtaG